MDRSTGHFWSLPTSFHLTLASRPQKSNWLDCFEFYLLTLCSGVLVKGVTSGQLDAVVLVISS